MRIDTQAEVTPAVLEAMWHPRPAAARGDRGAGAAHPRLHPGVVKGLAHGAERPRRHRRLPGRVGEAMPARGAGWAVP